MFDNTLNTMKLFKKHKQKMLNTTNEVVEHLNTTYPTGSFVVVQNIAARAKHFAIIRDFVVASNPMFVEPHFILYSSAIDSERHPQMKFLKDCSRFAVVNHLAQNFFRPMTVEESCQLYDALNACKLTFDPFTNKLKNI